MSIFGDNFEMWKLHTVWDYLSFFAYILIGIFLDAAKPLYDPAEEPGGGRKADHAALEAAGRTESEAFRGRDLKASGGGAEAGRFAGG